MYKMKKTLLFCCIFWVCLFVCFNGIRVILAHSFFIGLSNNIRAEGARLEAEEGGIAFHLELVPFNDVRL